MLTLDEIFYTLICDLVKRHFTKEKAYDPEVLQDIQQKFSAFRRLYEHFQDSDVFSIQNINKNHPGFIEKFNFIVMYLIVHAHSESLELIEKFIAPYDPEFTNAFVDSKNDAYSYDGLIRASDDNYFCLEERKIDRYVSPTKMGRSILIDMMRIILAHHKNNLGRFSYFHADISPKDETNTQVRLHYLQKLLGQKYEYWLTKPIKVYIHSYQSYLNFTLALFLIYFPSRTMLRIFIDGKTYFLAEHSARHAIHTIIYHLNENIDPLKRPLTATIRDEHIEVVRMLLQHFYHDLTFNPDIGFAYRQYTDKDAKYLAVAASCCYGITALTEQFLQFGVPMKRDDGIEALPYVVLARLKENGPTLKAAILDNIELLLIYGANVNWCDGKTIAKPMALLAAEASDLPLLKLLLRYKANVELSSLIQAAALYPHIVAFLGSEEYQAILDSTPGYRQAMIPVKISAEESLPSQKGKEPEALVASSSQSGNTSMESHHDHAKTKENNFFENVTSLNADNPIFKAILVCLPDFNLLHFCRTQQHFNLVRQFFLNNISRPNGWKHLSSVLQVCVPKYTVDKDKNEFATPKSLDAIATTAMNVFSDKEEWIKFIKMARLMLESQDFYGIAVATTRISRKQNVSLLEAIVSKKDLDRLSVLFDLFSESDKKAAAKNIFISVCSILHDLHEQQESGKYQAYFNAKRPIIEFCLPFIDSNSEIPIQAQHNDKHSGKGKTHDSLTNSIKPLALAIRHANFDFANLLLQQKGVDESLEDGGILHAYLNHYYKPNTLLENFGIGSDHQKRLEIGDLIKTMVAKYPYTTMFHLDSDGRTPLMIAAMHADQEMVMTMLKSIKQEDKDYTAVAKKLLHAKDWSGRTAVEHAPPGQVKEYLTSFIQALAQTTPDVAGTSSTHSYGNTSSLDEPSSSSRVPTSDNGYSDAREFLQTCLDAMDGVDVPSGSGHIPVAGVDGAALIPSDNSATAPSQQGSPKETHIGSAVSMFPAVPAEALASPSRKEKGKKKEKKSSEKTNVDPVLSMLFPAVPVGKPTSSQTAGSVLAPPSK